MSRKARIKSTTGIYHVLVRAISGLSLFTDEEDTQVYTNILNDLQRQGRCEVYAYALFPTHVHLLLREGSNDTASLRYEQSSTIQAGPYDNSHRNEVNRSETYRSEANRNEVNRSTSESSSSNPEPIGSVMKRLASTYSYFFNVKYDHYGPIYMDRFKSNPVETKDYFLKVLNHIGSQDCEYKFTCHHIPNGLVSAKPNDNGHRSETYRNEVNRSTSASSSFPPLLEYKERSKRITDSKLLAYLQTNFQFTNIGEFLQRPDDDIKATIKAAKQIGGSIRQIVRLTGSPYQSVFQIK